MALRVRMNQAFLSSDERKRFVTAVKKMKSLGTYDWYVQTHIDSMWRLKSGDVPMWAHMRPAFLPWHRQFILDFENDLRAADTAVTDKPSDLTLPYWDWINDRSSSRWLWWGRMWTEDFMGLDGSATDKNKVTGDPFGEGKWKPVYKAGLNYQPYDELPQETFLQRAFGRTAGGETLPTQEQWDAARAITSYDAPPYDSNVGRMPPPATPPVRFAGLTSFRNVFEGWVPYYDSVTAAPADPNLHNRVHEWVGGSMSSLYSSPNDPAFFLHHCNVDRLWALWWSDDPKRPYLPADGVPNPTDPSGEMQPGPEVINLQGHHLHDPMPPWDGTVDPDKGTMPKVAPADVLNHIKLGYAYFTDPPSLTAAGKP